MTAEAIVAVSAAVVAFVQLIKWAGMKDSYGPIVVIGFSGVGVVIWLISQATFPPMRTDTWDIFAGWIAVALSAAGVFGFTRAGAAAVTRAVTPPADGAGSSTTADEPDELATAILALTPEERAELLAELETRRRTP